MCGAILGLLDYIAYVKRDRQQNVSATATHLHRPRLHSLSTHPAVRDRLES